MTTTVERAKARKHHADCEAACELAETSAVNLWDALANVHRLEAWRVRDGGYPSFTAWAQVKLNVSERQSFRYLAKAKAVAELAEATGVSVEAAAEQVALTPPPTHRPAARKSTKPAVVNWGKPVKAVGKLRVEISHWNPGEIPPTAREALEALLRDLQAVLGARLT